MQFGLFLVFIFQGWVFDLIKKWISSIKTLHPAKVSVQTAANNHVVLIPTFINSLKPLGQPASEKMTERYFFHKAISLLSSVQ